MSEPLEITQQKLLHSPPVYRRFLGGGADALRLSPWGAGAIMGIGALTAVFLLRYSTPDEPWSAVSSGCAATIAAAATTAVAARWLGSRVGVLCGCLYLLSGRILSGTCPAGDHWFAALAVAAVGFFALANVAGRLPTASGRLPAVVFYCLVAALFCFFGPAAAAGVVLTCVAFLFISQNSRGVRFLADWLGLGVLAAAVLTFWLFLGQYTLYPVQSQWAIGNVFSPDAWNNRFTEFFHLMAVEIPFDTTPWWPLAVVAIFMGLRRGHYETPFGKLLTAWTVAPLVLVPAGLMCGEKAAAMVFSPLVILCGLGLNEVLAKTAQIYRKRKIG